MINIKNMIEQDKIDHCIKAIQNRLNDPNMDIESNSHVKEGYIKALEILKKKIYRYTGSGIENLSNTQSRAIAILAVDFVSGECSEQILIGVPIKNE